MELASLAARASLTSLVLLLAGCGSPERSDDGDGSPPAPDSSSYTVAVTGMPVAPLDAGEQFRINVTYSGNVTRSSDHLGAHFGNNSTTQPSTTVYPAACVHQSGNIPGTFQVTCTAPQDPGLYYLRGHGRITIPESNTTVNWWSEELTFTVAPLQN